MALDEFERIIARAEEQVAELRVRMRNATADFDSRTYDGRSDNGLAMATVSPDGMVTAIHLPRGLGNIATGSDIVESAWGAPENNVDVICGSIVEAVNRARFDVIHIGVDVLRHEFPGAFDLLTDLAPAPVAPAE